MKRQLAIGVSLIILGVPSLAACGDSDDGSDVADANTAFCGDLAAFATAVGDLAALDPATATTDDYEAAADEVSSTCEAMAGSAETLAEAELENLETQADALRDQLEDAPDDQAVQSILAEAQPQAAAVQASIASINTAVCTVGTSTTTGG